MQNITNIVKSLVVAVLLAALVSQVAIANANAQEADEQGDELIMYPTNIENCFVVDMQAEADENGGDLSDGDVVLRDELFELGWFSLAGDEQEYMYSYGCSESPEFVSGLPDEARFDFASQWKLPEPSQGYTWAEDLTQVPNSFYSNYKGGDLSSPTSSAKKATVTSDTVKEAPKASDSSAMKKAKELAAKSKKGKSTSKSSESSKSCKAEDGSTIENCKDYYSPAPKTSDDGWLVLVMDKGTTKHCSVFTNDRAEADRVASEYKASGKGAAVVHYTKSLDAKSPSC